MALETLTWEHTCEAIATLYGTDAQTIANTLTSNGVAVGDVESAFKMLEGTSYEIWYNNDGSVRSYNYVGTSNVNTNPITVDSNVATTEKVSVNVPLNSTPSVTDPTKASWTAGIKSAGNFVFKSVLPAVSAASVGITLGKAIDSALYNANPDYWDSIGWSSLNPDTWATITQNDDSGLATAFNFIYKIDPNTNKSQAYMDEMAFAYLTGILHNKGFFATGEIVYPPTPQPSDIITVTSFISLHTLLSECIPNPLIVSGVYTDALANGFPEYGCYSTNFLSPTTSGGAQLFYNPEIINGTIFSYAGDFSNVTRLRFYVNVNSTDPNIAYRFRDVTTGQTRGKSGFIGLTGSGGHGPGGATTMGTINGTEGSATEGITDQTGATTFDDSGISDTSDISAILALLMSQYPDLFNNAVEHEVIQPDGSTRTYRYIPVATPNENTAPTQGHNPSDQPVIANSTQLNPEFDPETAPESQIQYMIDLLTSIATSNDENTGSGDTPAVVIPTGSASALYTVYNPTNSEINSFGSWLWSANFVDQLLKMFNDPMQAIISLHKVFCTPSVSGRNNIKVGYLDSGVAANVVNSQYVTIDCGTVNLSEEFQNVFDYTPFTEINLYLPFVGFVRLDTNDVMRGSINVVYHVDVLTGACLAEVNVTRDMFGGVIYQYTGDCSVHYPLSSGSYMGMVSALLGVAGTIASGGSLAPMVIGATAKAMNGRMTVERSGNLSGNAGAMGIKKPYLVIQRPQSNLANVFETFVGKPANYTAKISDCTGFISCTEVHIENCNGTDAELAELENLLKTGILI